MPSAVLFSSASFEQPAQSTVLRSIECSKSTNEPNNDFLQQYFDSGLSKISDKVDKKIPLSSSSSFSILRSVDFLVEHDTINTINERQETKLDETPDFVPSAKKRKLKIIPNVVKDPKTEDTKTKIVSLMSNVSIFFFFVIIVLINVRNYYVF